LALFFFYSDSIKFNPILFGISFSVLFSSIFSQGVPDIAYVIASFAIGISFEHKFDFDNLNLFVGRIVSVACMSSLMFVYTFFDFLAQNSSSVMSLLFLGIFTIPLSFVAVYFGNNFIGKCYEFKKKESDETDVDIAHSSLDVSDSDAENDNNDESSSESKIIDEDIVVTENNTNDDSSPSDESNNIDNEASSESKTIDENLVDAESNGDTESSDNDAIDDTISSKSEECSSVSDAEIVLEKDDDSEKDLTGNNH